MSPRSTRIPAVAQAILSLSLLLASAAPASAHGGGHGGAGSGGHPGVGQSHGTPGPAHHGGGVINPSTVHHPAGSGDRGSSSWSSGAGTSGDTLAFNPYDLPEARFSRFVQHLFHGDK